MRKENENDQIIERKKNLERIKSLGIDAYGSSFEKKELIEVILARYSAEEQEQNVAIAGRIIAQRIMGKVVFATLQDESGTLQIFIKKDLLGEEQFSLFKDLDIGDIIAVEGELFRTRVGEITVRVKKFLLMAKSLCPLPEKYHGLTDSETKYRYRYLDLISNRKSFEVFKQRSLISQKIRSFLNAKGYLEVETPMLQSIAGGATARPFETFYNALNQKMYMRIATEIFLKQLLVGGFEKIYEMNRNFRNEGLSRYHNPEFTSLELYHAFGDCKTVMKLMQDLIQELAREVVKKTIVKSENNEEIDLSSFRKVDYRDLICEKTQKSNWFELPREEKELFARKMNGFVDKSMQDYQITHEIYEKLIEPTLIQPTFVLNFPYQLIPLAKRLEDDPNFVEVFELVIGGKEIGPGYTELNDPVEQKRRLDLQLQITAKTEEAESGKIDRNFLKSLEYGMPPAGGLGLGIDRLTMLLTETYSIRDVILFPQLKSSS